VAGFPTMVFVRSNLMTTYTGDRDINNLKAFARSEGLGSTQGFS
jgi:hypothetical protein